MFKFKPDPASDKDKEQFKTTKQEAAKVRGWVASSFDPKTIEQDDPTHKVIVPKLPDQMHYTLTSMLKATVGDSEKSAVLTGEMIARALKEFGRYVHSTDFTSKQDTLHRLGEGMPDLFAIQEDLKTMSPNEFNAKWGIPLACSVMALSAVFDRMMHDPTDYSNLRAIWLDVTKSKEDKA